VPLFGLGEQLSLPLTTFWHAERLAYWQFNAPLAPLMQNLPLPVDCVELLPIVSLLSIDEVCALAMEMPAIIAATAVRVVNVFMITS
jgi:hypothetical protein